MQANTKYKNSVFTLLFSDGDLLRELYCAIEGVSLSPDTPVEINTLHDALFMDRINDISFEIGGRLVVLIEHQSTVNPNIPLRMLMYIARVYEKIVSGKRNIYASRRVRIPFVEFIVLYNGTAPCPDMQVLRLSDMYEDPTSLGLPVKGPPALELVVKVVNINQGRNTGIAGRCQVLGWYSAFIAKVREFEQELGDRTEAVKRAVMYCREQDILREFLEKHGTEVLNMLMAEWNQADALAVRYEEGLNEGRIEGLNKGRIEGRDEGWNEGRGERDRELLDLIGRGYTLEEIQRELSAAARK